MSDGSSIEWTDATLQVSYGCSRVDHRCTNCYAMRLVHRGLAPAHRGLTKVRPKDASFPGVDWNGTVRLAPENLDVLARWRKPRRVFVNSLSDLFHPSIPMEFIAAVYKAFAQHPRHTALVLTKRDPRPFYEWASKRLPYFEETGASWPLPNVHLGRSVSDQATFDADVPELAECPAAVRFLSIEPLLGPIDTRQAIYREPGLAASVGEFRRTWLEVLAMGGPGYLSSAWVIVGGESGPGARPCRVDWIRSIVQQCRDVGVPVFVKQLGANYTDVLNAIGGAQAKPPEEYGPLKVRLRDRKGGDIAEWPEDLRVREFPEVPLG